MPQRVRGEDAVAHDGGFEKRGEMRESGAEEIGVVSVVESSAGDEAHEASVDVETMSAVGNPCRRSKGFTGRCRRDREVGSAEEQ